MTHDQLKQTAINAVRELFSDGSVSPLDTADAMEEIREEIRQMIDLLRSED